MDELTSLLPAYSSDADALDHNEPCDQDVARFNGPVELVEPEVRHIVPILNLAPTSDSSPDIPAVLTPSARRSGLSSYSPCSIISLDDEEAGSPASYSPSITARSGSSAFGPVPRPHSALCVRRKGSADASFRRDERRRKDKPGKPSSRQNSPRYHFAALPTSPDRPGTPQMNRTISAISFSAHPGPIPE